MTERNFENRALYHCDNLDVLRGMNSETVDLIATDPPFNKNKDFHATPDSLSQNAKFVDRWSWNRDVHESWIDQIEDDWPSVKAVIEAARIASGEDMAAFLCWLGVRIIEMRRVLKPTGSIYLHIDHTAHAWVKSMMDGIFGRKQFCNEIVWCYKSGGASPNRYFSRKHDSILFYTRTASYLFNSQREKSYNRGLKPYRFQGVNEYKDEIGWDTLVGMKDYWNIDMVGRTSGERTGYPTQKPLALYERIIEASSNEGDMVLDPFAGCATTPIAAERLGRQWVGIDIWDGAYKTVLDRLQSERLAVPDGSPLLEPHMFTFGDVLYSKYAPERTDEGEVAAPKLRLKIQSPLEVWQRLSRKQIVEYLVEAQASSGMVICGGCGRLLENEFMHLDHIQPRAEGGANDITNRILLCPPCNSRKGANLTLRGLLRDNKRVKWMQDEGRAKLAQSKARDVAERVRSDMMS